MEKEEYKCQIITMIEQCNNHRWLSAIYGFIKTLLNR